MKVIRVRRVIRLGLSGLWVIKVITIIRYKVTFVRSIVVNVCPQAFVENE
jgi:hypothetical protein